MTDWYWEVKENEEQKYVFQNRHEYWADTPEGRKKRDELRLLNVCAKLHLLDN